MVHVGLEQAPLGETSLQRHRDRRLTQLSEHGAIRRQEERAGELLGDRASTLRDPPLPEVRERGAGDAARIQRAVLVEAAILHGQQRGDQVLRHLVEPDGHPVPAALSEGRPDHLGIEQELGDVVAIGVPNRRDARIALEAAPKAAPETHPRAHAGVDEGSEAKRAAAHEKIAAAGAELSGLRCTAGDRPVADPLQVVDEALRVDPITSAEGPRPCEEARRGREIERRELARHPGFEGQIAEAAGENRHGQEHEPPTPVHLLSRREPPPSPSSVSHTVFDAPGASKGFHRRTRLPQAVTPA